MSARPRSPKWGMWYAILLSDCEGVQGETPQTLRTMKKLIAGAAAVLAAVPFTPALAQSSWALVGESVDGDRHYVQKHNWQGRYRTFEVITIDVDGSKDKALRVADCQSWKSGSRGDNRWVPALPGTMGDARLRYVCS